MRDTVCIPVIEPTQVGESRRTAVHLAERLGFDATETGKVALIVTEAAGNLVKHAGGGELLLRPLDRGGTVGLEVLALDKGPGLDPARCLHDGYSTAGSPGTGLGAIGRLASVFALHSAPAAGTALLAQVWRGARPSPSHADPVIGAVCVPVAGETDCGDAWAMVASRGRHLFLVADGLGHGRAAAGASEEAVRVFRDRADLEPVEIIQAMHAALRGTRGAAVALAAVDFAAGQVRFAGIGNVAAAVVWPGGSRSLVSHNGTVGHLAPRVQEFVYPFPPDALLILHSDGLTGRWRMADYPGLSAQHPGMVAGVLYRDFRRGRDDVTVLAARAGEGTGLAP